MSLAKETDLNTEYPIRSQSKIAILMAVYNGEKYVRRQLESLKSQTYQDFCCYIHDDGSKDDTVNIVKSFCAENPERFRLLSGAPTGGAKNNFMFLLRAVSAEYIMFCDQDDCWLPDKVEKTLAAMERAKHKDRPICVYTDLKIVDTELSVISDSYYAYTSKNARYSKLKQLLWVNVVVGCTMMINRPLRELTLKLKNMDNIFMHDWWAALLAAAKGKIIFLNEPTILYRQHADNSVGATASVKLGERLRQLLDIKTEIKRKRIYYERPVLFAKELRNVIDKNDPNYPLIKGLSELDHKSKLARIRFYREHKLFRQGKNTLWQMLWV